MLKIILHYRVIPMVAMLLALQFVYVVYSELREKAEDIASASSEMMAEEAANHLSRVFADEFFILEYMASDWQQAGGIEREIWLSQAHRVVEHYKFQAVSWVEGTNVRWIVPLVGNEKAIDLDLTFEESRRIAIARSTDTGRVSLGGPMALVQGGTGLLIFAPIFDEEHRVGFINGVIKTEPHFAKIMSGLRCESRVSSDDMILYSSSDFDGGAAREVEVEGFIFKIETKCEPQVGQQSYLFLVGFCILIGILTEMMISFISFRGRIERETRENTQKIGAK